MTQPKDVTTDDMEMAKEFTHRERCINSEDWMPIARLIAEVRTEQRQLDAEICEDYAEQTTFVRKAQAAKECGRRIVEGPRKGMPGAPSGGQSE